MFTLWTYIQIQVLHYLTVLESKLHSDPELGVEHLTDLNYPDADPPCHFCCKQSSTSIHDENRLKIVSGGLVRSRDGSREGGGTHYMNLPSPNVQSEGNDEGVFKQQPLSYNEEDEDEPGGEGELAGAIGGDKLAVAAAAAVAAATKSGSLGAASTIMNLGSRPRTRSGASGGGGSTHIPLSLGPNYSFGSSHQRDSDSDIEDDLGPPASALTRRRALIPPKLLSDGDEDGGSADSRRLSSRSDGNTPRARRSSIVVIPPMQICPGDLLVYSKVLTQRNDLLDVDGSSPSLTVSDADAVSSRKGKNTWSLLRLFDRSSRGKSESLCGLEEVLSCMQKMEFNDEQLHRFKGMCWSDFVSYIDSDRGHKSSDDESSDSCSSSPSPTPSPHPTQKAANDEDAKCMPSPEQSASPVITKAHISPPPCKPMPIEKPGPRIRIPLMRTQSEKSFERRVAGAMWRGLDKALPERVLPLRPSPLVQTLSEKNLLGSKEALASPVSTTSRNESKRREAIWDLYQSECTFLYDHLMVLKNVYMEPLKKIQVEGYAMFAEPELLFGNLDELCCVTYAFCKEFINLILQHVGANGDLPTTEVLVKLFQKSSKADSVSQAYHCYALNYINALNYLETLRRHIDFCEFEKWCNRDPRCKKLQLTDLLVAPVQHIMKVPLILKEIESRTEDAAEREQIGQILEMEENSLRELDDKMKWLKNFERLLEIQRNIVWPSVLELDPKLFVPEFLKPALSRQPCDRIIVSPRRQIILEGPLQLWDTGKPQEMFVILFDDMLLITRRKKGLSKKKSSLTENWPSSCSRGSGSSESALRYIVYKQPLSLDRFFIHDVSLPESAACRIDTAFIIVSLNRFQQIVAVHTFQAPSDQIKQTWLLKLRDTQDKWKRTLQHTVFRSPRLSTCSSRKSAT
ncbi:uncharacterized protein LOC124171204 [Ischnura elegans]|uniref:uncharacterized protein LOC124171204 n=1 Tax=Ischnura elegans TaxID=197161 RepID=UPI001ED889CE|nr:uncharacterized protein LOC124171204 [Ischnura elegans]